MPGIEARVSSICWCSWNNIAMLCAHLGFIVHTLSLLWNDGYRCREQDFQAFGGGLKNCKLRMRVQDLVQTSIFCWFPVIPTYSHQQQLCCCSKIIKYSSFTWSSTDHAEPLTCWVLTDMLYRLTSQATFGRGKLCVGKKAAIAIQCHWENNFLGFR